MKNRSLAIFAIITVACFGVLPHMLAAPDVAPPPDGCYPGYTTAEGCNALAHRTTGLGNTGLGWGSVSSVTGGNFNTGAGAGTLILNTADSNTAVGAAALLLNTTGTDNTAVGTDALAVNVLAVTNTAVGVFAAQNNDSSGAGTAAFNTAVGGYALQANVNGTRNTAVGAGAMEVGGGGNDNTAVGELAGNGITGAANTVLGKGAGTGITSGGNNVCIGLGAGSNLATASGNIYIGNANPPGPGLEFNTIRINDSLPQVAGTNSQVFIGGIWMATIGGANAIVGVNANGQLGTATSSARFKKDIESMGDSSEAIFSLRPVSFRYKGDETNLPCFGLIAEEVAKVNPDLILQDKEGKPWTVRYEQINAMLLNEFLKEHKKVEAQQASISELKSEMHTMVAQLKEQAAQIQKVSAQLEMNKPAPQVVANKP
jgi:hypothetical protein